MGGDPMAAASGLALLGSTLAKGVCTLEARVFSSVARSIFDGQQEAENLTSE